MMNIMCYNYFPNQLNEIVHSIFDETYCNGKLNTNTQHVLTQMEFVNCCDEQNTLKGLNFCNCKESFVRPLKIASSNKICCNKCP